MLVLKVKPRAALPPGKTRYPLHRRLRGDTSHSHRTLTFASHSKKKKSEVFPSNQVSAAGMTSASDEKWRTFNFFFQSGRAKDLSAPLYSTIYSTTDRSDRAVQVVRLIPLAFCDCEFDSRRGHWGFSLLSVVCSSGRGLCVGLITCLEDFCNLQNH